MIFFFLINILSGSSAFILVSKIFKFKGLADSLTCLFLFFFAQVVATEMILGLSGALYLGNLIFLNLAVFFFIWYFTRNKEARFPWIEEGFWKLIFSNKPLLLCFSIIMAFGTTKIMVNLFNAPFGWDSLNYHFTFPVEWLKNGNLDNPITISDDPSPTYYPINGSLFFLWLILPLKNVMFADLGQLPFFFLCALSVYSICKKLKMDTDYSLLSAGLFLLIPNLFKQLQVAYVDLMVGGLFLAALNFLFLVKEEFSLKNVLLFSISLGLLIGTKTVGLPYAALLFLPFIFLSFKNFNRGYLFIFSLALILAFGGFSYLRNFLETGNPLYPLNLAIFNKTVFKGALDSAVYRAHFTQEDYSLAKLLFHEGLGPQSLLFILPGVFIAPLAALFNKKRNLYPVYLLCLPLLIYLVWRFIIPLPNSRYLYPLFGIGMAAGFLTAVFFKIPKKMIYPIAALCALGSVPELARRQELAASLLLSALLFFLFPVVIIKAKRIKAGIISYSLLAAFFILSLSIMNKYYAINEFRTYKAMVKYSGFWPDATKAWEWLNDNTSGENIAYVGRPVPFPLYGSNFKNNVSYVSVNKTDPVKLHFFPNSHYSWGYDFLSQHRNLEEKGNYRQDADYQTWLSNLLKKKSDFLFIYSLHQTDRIIFPVEDSWSKNDPSRFNQVFNNDSIHIYKITR